MLAGLKVSLEEAREVGITQTVSCDGPLRPRPTMASSSTDEYVIVTNPEDSTKLLQKAWGDIFAVKGDFDEEEAKSFLSAYLAVTKWDWGDCKPPSLESVEE